MYLNGRTYVHWQEHTNGYIDDCSRKLRAAFVILTIATVVIPIIALIFCRQSYINNCYAYRRYKTLADQTPASVPQTVTSLPTGSTALPEGDVELVNDKIALQNPFPSPSFLQTSPPKEELISGGVCHAFLNYFRYLMFIGSQNISFNYEINGIYSYEDCKTMQARLQQLVDAVHLTIIVEVQLHIKPNGTNKPAYFFYFRVKADFCCLRK